MIRILALLLAALCMAPAQAGVRIKDVAAVQGAPTIHAYAVEDVQTDRVSALSRRAYRLSLRVMSLVSKVVLRFVWGEVLALALVLGTAYLLFGRGRRL